MGMVAMFGVASITTRSLSRHVDGGGVGKCFRSLLLFVAALAALQPQLGTILGMIQCLEVWCRLQLDTRCVVQLDALADQPLVDCRVPSLLALVLDVFEGAILAEYPPSRRFVEQDQQVDAEQDDQDNEYAGDDRVDFRVLCNVMRRCCSSGIAECRVDGFVEDGQQGVVVIVGWLHIDPQRWACLCSGSFRYPSKHGRGRHGCR